MEEFIQHIFDWRVGQVAIGIFLIAIAAVSDIIAKQFWSHFAMALFLGFGAVFYNQGMVIPQAIATVLLIPFLLFSVSKIRTANNRRRHEYNQLAMIVARLNDQELKEWADRNE